MKSIVVLSDIIRSCTATSRAQSRDVMYLAAVTDSPLSPLPHREDILG